MDMHIWLVLISGAQPITRISRLFWCCQAANPFFDVSIPQKPPLSFVTDEKSLIEGCLKGHESYHFELYKRYAGKMMVVCKRYAGNKQEAEDFLQEAFIRIFDKLHTFSHNGSLEGWIRRVVTHTALNKLRTRKLYSDIDDDAPFADTDAPDALNNLGEKDLLNLIQQLPTGYRMVFNMYAIDGYDHGEIATALGITEGTSRSQLAKARMSLKEAILKQQKIKEHAYQA
jgi:RNA polymerase sigma factor (sigma-70 family)